MTDTEEKKKSPVLVTLEDESVGRWLAEQREARSAQLRVVQFQEPTTVGGS